MDADPGDRLCIALDFPAAAPALAFVDRLETSPGKRQCRWVKVGLELYIAEGPAIISALRGCGLNIFLDLKLHDIPNTVASAVRRAARLGVSLLTVHASGGPAMLQAAQSAAADTPGMRLLAVTVLTSQDQASLDATGVSGSVADQVLRLGSLSIACGISGLVCSVQEAACLRREFGPDTLLVVPGIRDAGASVLQDDQSRVATASDAIREGASMLVVGRPITRAADPAAATARLLDQIRSAADDGGRA